MQSLLTVGACGDVAGAILALLINFFLLRVETDAGLRNELYVRAG
jgi:hypothetical protein